jgi:hypothetical protein
MGTSLLYVKIDSHQELGILYICILLHIAISLSLFLSVFCAACQCFKTLFSVLNTCHFKIFKTTEVKVKVKVKELGSWERSVLQ